MIEASMSGVRVRVDVDQAEELRGRGLSYSPLAKTLGLGVGALQAALREPEISSNAAISEQVMGHLKRDDWQRRSSSSMGEVPQPNLHDGSSE
jgi:hypothetical protein